LIDASVYESSSNVLFFNLFFQGIAFCDLPEDTMLPGEM